ncbi:Neural cell adhesion molecule 1 [Orchesella cincta]|uniref:Neural cell adhesion molecule 1 n=1 Tax=Orchesella cincta TaxID=48709 RepID=A0A1D2NBT3_ORCCI|nr:Neural cell adhesion molecule 1 [Orchesella cincta]
MNWRSAMELTYFSIGSQHKMKDFIAALHQKAIEPRSIFLSFGLMIHNVSQHDAYRQYMCRAMDMDSPIPDTKVMNITLKVKMKPRLTGNAKTEHWGVLGEWANLTCLVKAEPPAKFEWLHRGRSLSPSDEIFIVTEENKSTLQVLVQHESKFGDYSCRARNELGQMNRTMTLFKGQKPPPPVLEEELATPDAVKIRVKQGPSGIDRTKDPAADEERKKGKLLPIIGYVVQYKMATRGDWTTANVTKYDGGFILRGLTPQITYYIRAASKNVASVGDFSNPLKVITPKTSPWKITDTAANVHPSSVVAVLCNLVILQFLASLL